VAHLFGGAMAEGPEMASANQRPEPAEWSHWDRQGDPSGVDCSTSLFQCRQAILLMSAVPCLLTARNCAKDKSRIGALSCTPCHKINGFGIPRCSSDGQFGYLEIEAWRGGHCRNAPKKGRACYDTRAYCIRTGCSHQKRQALADC